MENKLSLYDTLMELLGQEAKWQDISSQEKVLGQW